MNHVTPQNETSLVAQAAAYLRERWDRTPKIGVILGTGLGGLTDLVREEINLRYGEIPGFLQSTALAHVGRFVGGSLQGVPAVFLQGRCHLYEGHRIGSLVLPTQVLHALGASILIVTNASGGLNPRFRSGDVMIVEDHLNFLFRRPAINGNGQPPNIRPSGATPFSQKLAKIAAKATQTREQFVQFGTYAAMLGPSYETRAEYRMLRKLGADAVGMSTVPESLVGASLGMEVLGLSVITNVAMPDAIGKVDAQEVCDIATSAAPVIRTILRGIAAVT